MAFLELIGENSMTRYTKDFIRDVLLTIGTVVGVIVLILKVTGN